ncbi:Glucoamylase, intracellular sporulation-specific [Zancudomyces culisetae]|uniref:glucan 1,4-alpha-glucosidase n=1 Tax=Zancudomyces culisetae TaxID=1213189 RepID=A0A1R1PFW1_ZANCU|nr:Glucoamylase, intracellular sporulation-specific [Zancudomyces culisetae]OMH79998.1 Glucoamylase, intracellular sporulation-specific [Zancudomyces culisetae]|eukprot:OMH79861.1 Glucoamylase, intracellular sporulation-specific [Zancudomyces culisetae]
MGAKLSLTLLVLFLFCITHILIYFSNFYSEIRFQNAVGIAISRIFDTGRPGEIHTLKELEFEEWIVWQYKKSISKLKSNLNLYKSNKFVQRGAICASPSKSEPDYFYHWTRDSALTISYIIFAMENSIDSESLYYSKHSSSHKDQSFLANPPSTKEDFHSFVNHYINFTNYLVKYKRHPVGDLGEPKFYMNGELFLKSWGRPQNDGPALRSIANIQYINFLFSNRDRLGKSHGAIVGFLTNFLLCDDCVLSQDLKYLSSHYLDPSFDIWEEVCGTHFYNVLVTSKAFEMASQLYLDVLNNRIKSKKYHILRDKLLKIASNNFWNNSSSLIMSTIDYKKGIYKSHDFLDTQTILAWIHTFNSDSFFVKDAGLLSKTLTTLVKLLAIYKDLYPINYSDRNAPGVAVGRYPGDKYNGYNSHSLGNPWPLLTCSIAEFYYKLVISSIHARKLVVDPSLSEFLLYSQNLLYSASPYDTLLYKVDPLHGITNKALSSVYIIRYELEPQRLLDILSLLIHSADLFAKRVKFHSPSEGFMNEQWDRYTGFHTGAPDLTWSYTAFLSMIDNRRIAKSLLDSIS